MNVSLVGSSQGTDVSSSSALTLIRELRERLRRRGKRSKVRGKMAGMVSKKPLRKIDYFHELDGTLQT